VAGRSEVETESAQPGGNLDVGEVQGVHAGGVRRAKTIPYPKFKKIERSLCVFIRGHEAEAGVGMQQKDIVEWYLNQQEDIASIQELGAERRLVRQVIQRLLVTDNILVEVDVPEGAPLVAGVLPQDSRYISVRPHVEM